MSKRRPDLFFSEWRKALDVDPDGVSCICNAFRVALWMKAGRVPYWEESERALFLSYCKQRKIETTGTREQGRQLLWALGLKNPKNPKKNKMEVQIEATF